MATELGPGVRVYVGAIPLHKRRDSVPHCYTGVVVREASPLEVVVCNVRAPCWRIKPDEESQETIVHESVIFPIDDWDESEDTNQKENSPLEVET